MKNTSAVAKADHLFTKAPPEHPKFRAAKPEAPVGAVRGYTEASLLEPILNQKTLFRRWSWWSGLEPGGAMFPHRFLLGFLPGPNQF